MIEEKTEAQLIEEFYSKPYNLSYSALNKLLYSPGLFYRHYVLQQRDDISSLAMSEGKIIHSLILDDGSFDTEFIIMPTKLPSDSPRAVIDKVFSKYMAVEGRDPEATLLSMSDSILETLIEVNLYQSLKTDLQRIDKINDELGKSYFEFLKIKDKKTLIDEVTMTRCKESVDAIKNCSKAYELLGLGYTPMDTYQIFNEILLETTNMNDHSFGLKGVVDNIKLDPENKIIYINDLKTSGKTLTEFPESIEFYMYWIQAAIYERLVRDKFSDLIDDTWQVVFHFIVIDRYKQVYCFPVSESTLSAWQINLEVKLAEIEFHISSRNYSLPYQFANNLVTL